MPHAIGGGGKASVPSYKVKDTKLLKALVIEDVQVLEKTIEVPVYKLVDKPTEQIKYVTKEESQVKYKTVEKPTQKYITKEESTVKYVVKEEQTTKYVSKEVEVERPVAVPKNYERPVIKEKIVELISYTDVSAIKQLMELMPQLLKDIKELKQKVGEIKDYKLVEKLIDAPRLQWVNTPVERIIWKDVERVRPKQ